ncbi:MAG: hypothetical protein Q7J80_14145, partial [Anaerolineales bacterium]|nr:hypothetical protein [Anaerolineales bacterium]
DEFDKKFGFDFPEKQPAIPPPLDADGVQGMLISNAGEAIAAPDAEPDLWPSDQVTWNRVHLRTSTQTAAYGIEIARTQASPDYPWRLAQQIAEAVKSRVLADQPADNVKSGAAVAVEIAACHLLLCGGDLTVASREQGANLLLQYLVELEAELTNESHPIAGEQLRRLRGLAALAFANLDPRTKRLLLENVVDALSSVRIVNQETCVALMAIISNGEHDTSHSVTLPNSFEQLVNDRFTVLNASATNQDKDSAKKLIWNFRQIAVTERNLVDQFKDALRFFGTAEHHGQYVVVKKDVAVAQSNNQDRKTGTADMKAGWALLRSAFLQAHSLICQGWQSISNT